MKYDTYLGVKMTSEQRRELQEFARLEERSENSVIRLALREYLSKRNEQTQRQAATANGN
jgi:hypothetical protein